MARKSLRDMEVLINTQSRDILGQWAVYSVGGGGTYTVLIQGDFSDGILSGEISSAVHQEVEIMIVKSDLPAKPNGSDRITIDRIGTTIFYPTNVQSDDTGLHWLMNIMEA